MNIECWKINILCKQIQHYALEKVKVSYKVSLPEWVFRRTWTDTEELLKEKSFFILSFVFLSEFVIRQVQTNIC